MPRKSRTTRRPTYGDAVLWLAHNDEPTLHDINEVASLCTVALASDLFGIPAWTMAVDIVRARHGAGRWAFPAKDITCSCATADRARTSGGQHHGVS